MRPYSAKIERIRVPKRNYVEMPFLSFQSRAYLEQKMTLFKEKFTPLIEENPDLEVRKTARKKLT
jgi:hypothetical protein